MTARQAILKMIFRRKLPRLQRLRDKQSLGYVVDGCRELLAPAGAASHLEIQQLVLSCKPTKRYA